MESSFRQICAIAHDVMLESEHAAGRFVDKKELCRV